MYCNKCGKELSNGAVFCNRCGASMKRTPMPLRSTVRSAVGSLAARGANRESMRFIMAGLAAVCALFLLWCFDGLTTIGDTMQQAQANLNPARWNTEMAEDWMLFVRMLSVVLPAAWVLGLTGFCGLVFSALAISRKMDEGKRLLRFSFVISVLSGLAILSNVIAQSVTGMNFSESPPPVFIGVLLCSIAGLLLMRMSPRLLAYSEDTLKRSVSGILIALVFFIGLVFLQSAYNLYSVVLISRYFGYLGVAAMNALTTASGGIMWPYLGWSLLLCCAAGLVLRGRLPQSGLPICFGIGALVGIIRAANSYFSLHSSVIRLDSDAELLGLIQDLELFPALQVFFFHCLLALFIQKAVNEQVRFRAAVITPIVFATFQLFLTLVFLAVMGFGLLGVYYAQILAIVISMIIIGFFRAPRTKRESNRVKQSAVVAKDESIIAQDSAPLFTPPPEEDGQAAESDDQPVPAKGSAPKKCVRVVLNIVIMLVVAAVCFLVIVVLPRVLDGDSLLAMTSPLLRTIRS